MAEAKILSMGDSNVPKLKAATSKVAGVINREMKDLQRKWPDYYFDLSFEVQRLGKKHFLSYSH